MWIVIFFPQHCFFLKCYLLIHLLIFIWCNFIVTNIKKRVVVCPTEEHTLMYWTSVKVVAWCRQYPLVGSFLVPLLQNIKIEWRNWIAMTSTCCWLCYHFQATCWAWRTGREFVDGAELDWAGGVRDAARAAQVFGFSGTAIKPQDKKNKSYPMLWTPA